MTLWSTIFYALYSVVSFTSLCNTLDQSGAEWRRQPRAGVERPTLKALLYHPVETVCVGTLASFVSCCYRVMLATKGLTRGNCLCTQ